MTQSTSDQGADAAVMNHYTQAISSLPDVGLPTAYSDVNGPTYHPLMLLAVLFFGYSSGRTTDEEIAAACQQDASFQYLCSGALPDAQVLGGFRKTWHSQIEKGFIYLLAALKSRGLTKIADLVLPSDQDIPAVAAELLAQADVDKASMNELMEALSGRPVAEKSSVTEEDIPSESRPVHDALRVEMPEVPVSAGPSEAELTKERKLNRRRRIEHWVAIAILLSLVMVIFFAYITRWPMNEDATNAVRRWVAVEYAANEVAELKPTWFDPKRERLAPQIADEALKRKNVEILSISSRGRGDEIAVRVEIAVLGEVPNDGRDVRYYSMVRDPAMGWEMDSEMTALSYYTRL